VSSHYTGACKNVLVLSERNSTGAARQISFHLKTSRQRRAEFDAIEALRRGWICVRPVER
jgi:hypothetical protein